MAGFLILEHFSSLVKKRQAVFEICLRLAGEKRKRPAGRFLFIPMLFYPMR